MYWAYLILFVCMIVTPELLRTGFLFFGEEDLESILIFCFGMLGLLLYLGKESAFLRAVREKLSLQQETNQIRRNLSHSYSYIGEVNRRIDIVKNMVVALPRTRTVSVDQAGRSPYDPILEATKLLAQSEAVALSLVNIDDATVLESYAMGEDRDSVTGAATDAQYLLNARKYLWEDGDFTFVRSPEEAQGVAAFIVFRKMKNRLDEAGIFQILAAEAVFVFAVSGRGPVPHTQLTVSL